jgi:hypothetical protein
MPRFCYEYKVGNNEKKLIAVNSLKGGIYLRPQKKLKKDLMHAGKSE